MRLILDGQSKWKTPAHRTEALVLTCAFQIVYMETIRQLKDAVVKCQEADPVLGFTVESDTGRHPVDNSAALIIGSLEGTQPGGSLLEDGELVWNLANKRAFQFQTVNEYNYAIVNRRLIDLLYAAKGELDGVACTKLQDTVDQIIRNIQVGIIQGVLNAAVESENLDSGSDHLSLVQGEVLAESIIPILAAHDGATGELIQENMVIKANVDTVRDGAQAVADGFGYYMTTGANLQCSYVGATGGANPCKNYGGGTSASGTLNRRGAALTLLTTAVTCFVFGTASAVLF